MLDYYRKEKKSRHRTFESCYKKYGEDWNGNRWRKGEDGVWREYSTYNPNAKWDWYVLGGRWSGCFIRLKADATSGVEGESGAFDNKVGYDAALKRDIDFDAIRREAEEKGRIYYREVAEKCGGTIPHLEIHWNTLLSDKRYANLSINEKRELYHSQEAVKVWYAAGFDSPFIGPQIEDFQCTEDDYAASCAQNSFIPYAYVINGEWHGQGDMGWFGVSTNECDRNDWCKQVWDMIESLPDDTLISFYDCHI